MNKKITTKVIVTAASAILVPSCIHFFLTWEITNTKYDNYNDARGAIDVGWVPNWLPKTSSNMNESHNIDTNQVWLKFHFDEPVNSFTKTCNDITKEEIIIPSNKQLKRYPKFVRNIHDIIMTGTNLKFFECRSPNGIYYLVIDEPQRIAYSWRL